MPTTTREITMVENETELLGQLLAELARQGIAFTCNLSCGEWTITLTGW